MLSDGIASSLIRGRFRWAFLFDSDKILIGNFPAEVLMLAALLDGLFKKNRSARIRDKRSGGRQKDIAGAILHLHTAAEKSRIARHPVLSVEGR